MLSLLMSRGVLGAPTVLALKGANDFMDAAGHSLPTGSSSGVSVTSNAPFAIALRSGSIPPSSSIAAVAVPLTPGITVDSISFSYRHCEGYATTGAGPSFTLSIAGTVAFESGAVTGFPYKSSCPGGSCYSPMVDASASSLAIKVPADGVQRITFEFHNTDQNLQLLLPMTLSLTCGGGPASCFVKPPTPPPTLTPSPTPPPTPFPPTPVPPATHTPWKMIGPWNIGDDVNGQGEAGTIHPAVSPIGNPLLMYMGGVNNAASSGVLKSVDGGTHWEKMNTGLFDTRPYGLFIVDDNVGKSSGQHVLAGTPSGCFETTDGAETWHYILASSTWGVCNSFRNGTINGKPYLFVGTNAGLGNVPLDATDPTAPLINKTWSLIKSPPGSATWRTQPVKIADFDGKGKPLENSVIVGCLWIGGHGVIHILTIVNATSAKFEIQADQACQSMAIDPNDATHMIVNNASNGAHVYESNDGGKTFHTCLDRRGAVMVAIDRRGDFYTGSEGGAFINRGGLCNVTKDKDAKWDITFVRRIARRNGVVKDRSAHDYQRINIDFAGSVAFGSDQGMFIRNSTNASENQLVNACGDINNNVIMHPAIAQAETPNEVCITTALWDWSPVASWDGGKHWPSWQTPDDGTAMGYFGEGGGCFGVGESKNVVCMHHHNVAYSSRCGKNMSRFVVPNGASVGVPTFMMKEGSRSIPAGPLFALMTMGPPPWDVHTDKFVACAADEEDGDLGVHNTSGSCLSQVDIGLEYGWYPGVTVAIWRGDGDKKCYICKKAGNPSSWAFTDQKGSVVIAKASSLHHTSLESTALKSLTCNDPPCARQIRRRRLGDDGDADADADADDYDDGDGLPGYDEYEMKRYMNKIRLMEMGREDEIPIPSSGLDVKSIESRGESTGNPKYVLKSWNFGANWTWVILPSFLQGLSNCCDFAVDPTNGTGVLYGVSESCIVRSYDQAETWTDTCWNAPGLTGSFKELVIKDSKTMLVMRNGAVPLRTKDGGKSWHQLGSLQHLASHSPDAAWSWSGKTLAVSTVIGQTVVWVSRDDGETWVDESGDYTAMSGGISQWYDNTLYISSMGQGISSKIFKE